MSDEYGLINIGAFNNINQEELIKQAAEIAKKLYDAVYTDILNNKLLLEAFASELMAKESLSESEIEEIFNEVGLIK